MSIAAITRDLEPTDIDRAVALMERCVPGACREELEKLLTKYIGGEDLAVIGCKRLGSGGFLGLAFLTVRGSALGGTFSRTCFVDEIFVDEERKGDYYLLPILLSGCANFAKRCGCRSMISCFDAEEYVEQRVREDWIFQGEKAVFRYQKDLTGRE